jgi:antitoxin (DNA-binding transcriptional repressor) of toxin-antitoxin stability system
MEVGVLEAKNRLSELLDRAERGEFVIITRHGRPVVSLTRMQAHRPSKAELEEILETVRQMRESLPPTSWEDLKRDRDEDRL